MTKSPQIIHLLTYTTVLSQFSLFSLKILTSAKLKPF